MDLMSPFVHEFTYQAMAHDLLPIKDGDKVTFHTTINQGTPEAEEKDMELNEKDKVWVENRHRHMKDTIDKLMGDFRKFLEANPHFANENPDTTSLNTIRDMLAGLPQFQEMKEAYSLHMTMAQECMNLFQNHKLPDVSLVEQTLATGLDEDYRKPKNILDSIVRLLDDELITPPDRLRLIIMYALYRDGIVMEDIKRLLAHASLPQADGEVLANLEHLGGRTTKSDLKDVRQPPPQLFPKDIKAAQAEEEYAMSRFDPVLKPLLDTLTKGTLDQTTFPYVKPPMDPNEDMLIAQGGSLRAGRPNWAAAGRRPPENRQRIIVFMAGGATYSESRSCYEIGAERSRDIVLVTSHMLTPQLFIRQVRDLSRDRRQLDLPVERPKPRAPAHLFERPAPPPGPGPGRPGPGQNMTAPPRPGRGPSPGAGPGRRPIGGQPGRPPVPPTGAMSNLNIQPGHGSPSPSAMDDGKQKEKKRRNFLGKKK
jgi:syntaxin-binding protein 1